MGCHLDRHDVYPSVHEVNPIKVAGLMDTRGREACRERWHWLNDHYLSDLAVRGRRLIAAGKKWPGPTAPKRRGPKPGQGRRRKSQPDPLS
ncbi:hypothetical protein [Methylobacterium sp. 391_Methyba4]|uniref:hypothetical protein n=1 Tax=Methylobacterium sp. 391_Methyba4 TaxID=3038924 RepID=UPI00241D8BCD|nr:hypothetical protein [Methylobacterium sp. 391_Methyba4]WFS10461.1 hypothetical protein P9K36_14775 [Methylobacterium sp. 391_Methyba4]